MSAIETSCYPFTTDKESGAGERSCLKSTTCESSNASYTIASEIMNDIVNNAFDVVMAKNLQLPGKVEKITPNVVGDILENILSPTPEKGVSSHDETALLDDEIKKIIKEMKYPPEQKNIVYTQGVGDQLSDKSEVTPDKILAEPVKRNTLERKNRLTNLVRNSKQMLAKLVTNETENEVRLAKSEEVHEKLLKVVDFDKDEAFMEPGSSSVTGIVHMPLDTRMDTVDLESNEIKNENENTDARETESKKIVESNKKKVSLASRIMKYLRRNRIGKD